jgi:hypothetical protein
MNRVAYSTLNYKDGLAITGNGVYATNYYDRSGGSNANFNGTANSATTAGSANLCDEHRRWDSVSARFWR